jgi:hypothetical protein
MQRNNTFTFKIYIHCFSFVNFHENRNANSFSQTVFRVVLQDIIYFVIGDSESKQCCGLLSPKSGDLKFNSLLPLNPVPHPAFLGAPTCNRNKRSKHTVTLYNRFKSKQPSTKPSIFLSDKLHSLASKLQRQESV